MKNCSLPFPFQDPTKLLITLNSRISKLTSTNQHSQALLLFAHLRCDSPHVSPDHYTLSSVLKSCAHLNACALGAQLHSFAFRSGLVAYSHVVNALLSFYAKTHSPDLTRKLFDSIASPDDFSYTTLLSSYAKSGQFEHALQLFDEMPDRTLPVWNAMITGFVDRGYRGSAVGFFVRMHRMGVGFDRYTFSSVLSLCESMEFMGFGWQVHSMAMRIGFLSLDCGDECIGNDVS